MIADGTSNTILALEWASVVLMAGLFVLIAVLAARHENRNQPSRRGY